MSSREKISRSLFEVFRISITLLEKRDKKRLFLVSILQSLVGLLDLLALALVGFISALIVRGVQSFQPGGKTLALLEFLGIDAWRFQNQVALLSALAICIMISKTIISAFLNKKIYVFLSIKASSIAISVLKRFLNPKTRSQSTHTQAEVFHVINYGIPTIVLGILGATSTVFSDVFLAGVLFLGLFLIDPSAALSSLIFFGLLGALVFKILNKRASRIGELQTDSLIKSTHRIEQTMRNFRELYVQDKLRSLFTDIEELRRAYAMRLADQLVMPNWNKYVLEIGFAVGTFAMAAFQFSSNTAPIAAANLAIFLVAASRLAPAIMRVQHAFLQMKVSSGEVSRTIDFMKSIQNSREITLLQTMPSGPVNKTAPILHISDLRFSYSATSEFKIEVDNLSIGMGESLAIVGRSGSGKSTLIDLMLGILIPESGKVLISGAPPANSYQYFPGLVAYVPQDIFLFPGTIAQNVSMEVNFEKIDYEKVIEVLNMAQLSELIESVPSGIHSNIGDFAGQLSGGEKQRIGIARALYSSPKLLFLDESTSALDSYTEEKINEVISLLKGTITTVTVAHRLSTVRNSDVIAYMENGTILDSGNFDDLKNRVPDFAYQAKLLGL